MTDMNIRGAQKCFQNEAMQGPVAVLQTIFESSPFATRL